MDLIQKNRTWLNPSNFTTFIYNDQLILLFRYNSFSLKIFSCLQVISMKLDTWTPFVNFPRRFIRMWFRNILVCSKDADNMCWSLSWIPKPILSCLQTYLLNLNHSDESMVYQNASIVLLLYVNMSITIYTLRITINSNLPLKITYEFSKYSLLWFNILISLHSFELLVQVFFPFFLSHLQNMGVREQKQVVWS